MDNRAYLIAALMGDPGQALGQAPGAMMGQQIPQHSNSAPPLSPGLQSMLNSLPPPRHPWVGAPQQPQTGFGGTGGNQYGADVIMNGPRFGQSVAPSIVPGVNSLQFSLDQLQPALSGPSHAGQLHNFRYGPAPDNENGVPQNNQVSI